MDYSVKKSLHYLQVYQLFNKVRGKKFYHVLVTPISVYDVENNCRCLGSSNTLARFFFIFREHFS